VNADIRLKEANAETKAYEAAKMAVDSGQSEEAASTV
jgi:hypothetical protein